MAGRFVRCQLSSLQLLTVIATAGALAQLIRAPIEGAAAPLVFDGVTLIDIENGDDGGRKAVATEVQELVATGVTPYQALATGTRSVAAFLGTLDSSGTIAVGKWADLVLLNADPLQNVGATAEVAGVVVAGRW